MTELHELDGMNLVKNQVTDASKWAESFNWHLASHGEQPIDPGLMIGWFANAMCVQMDVTNRERKEELEKYKAGYAVLKEAVDFYARPMNWQDYTHDKARERQGYGAAIKHMDTVEHEMTDNYANNEKVYWIFKSGGKRAREASKRAALLMGEGDE